MMLCVLSVRDVKADSFGRPFYTVSLGEAVRSFSDEINRSAEDNILYKHPEDFELYHLGMFNTDDGGFELVKAKQIAVGSTVQVFK